LLDASRGDLPLPWVHWTLLPSSEGVFEDKSVEADEAGKE